MFRTVRRWFSTEETKQLAKEVDLLQDRFLDIGHKLEGMQLRIDRHLNKLQMRDARATARAPRGDVLTDEERDILEDLRSRNDGPPPGRDPFFN